MTQISDSLISDYQDATWHYWYPSKADSSVLSSTFEQSCKPLLNSKEPTVV
jgi:hypothetical protein